MWNGDLALQREYLICISTQNKGEKLGKNINKATPVEKTIFDFRIYDGNWFTVQGKYIRC